MLNITMEERKFAFYAGFLIALIISVAYFIFWTPAEVEVRVPINESMARHVDTLPRDSRPWDIAEQSYEVPLGAFFKLGSTEDGFAFRVDTLLNCSILVPGDETCEITLIGGKNRGPEVYHTSVLSRIEDITSVPFFVRYEPDFATIDLVRNTAGAFYEFSLVKNPQSLVFVLFLCTFILGTFNMIVISVVMDIKKWR